jgi:hypothetical protein
MLAPTPRSLLTDSQGRPYCLWDMEMTLENSSAQSPIANRLRTHTSSAS